MAELLRVKETGPVAETLLRDGGVIVESVIPPEVVAQTLADLRGPFDEQGLKFTNEFNGFKTRRLSGILALSRASAEIIAHPLVMSVADAVLKRHCTTYRLGSSTAIEIMPGEGNQVLHRDDDFYPIRIPGVEFQISAMVALTDFTVENGATRVVPGSQDLRDIAGIPDSDVVQAAMPAGSVLFYLGSAVHAGGTNNTDKTRIGLITTYSLGWLRQEENMYLTMPRAVAEGYPEHVSRLIGYQSHGPYLGVYPGDPDGHFWGA
ncbi:phytanoyl-CoA dioxygenase family protein [Yoonia sp.]|uniref:phytanoyl-CoA dioxygenase family protein n=1 Tax=Yoonia sp. TaxID=2212373 RepID=UPI002FD8986B